MSNHNQLGPRTKITHRERIFLAIWSIGLVSLIGSTAWVTIVPVRSATLATEGRHRARLDPLDADPGATPPDLELPAGANPTRVKIGIYVDRIVELSVKDAGWTVDFYLWFAWKGDEVDPGNGFQVVDGSIESQQREEQHGNGDERYERYRVIARITKPFDVSRFPCDEHLLTINIENPRYQRSELLFIPDEANSGVSSRVRASAYGIHGSKIIEKPHSYKTTRGDPRLAAEAQSTYSQGRLGIELRRESWGFYFKMFQSLYVAVAIAMLTMFVKPTHVDPRFGLGVGGLFAAVANSYVTSSLIPETGVMTLADLVNGIGIGTILLTVIQSTVSLHLYERLELEAISRRFDQISIVIMASGYLALNLALPWAASAA